MTPLVRFALVARDRATECYSVHRLVQQVVQHSMAEDAQMWAERAVRALNRAFPAVEFANWDACRRMLPHTLVGAEITARDGLTFASAGNLLNEVAYFLYQQGRYEDAEPLYLQALEVLRTALGEDHTDFATGLNNLALLSQAQGRYQPLYLQVKEITRTALGEDHPHFATSLNNLAALYKAQGRDSEAAALLAQMPRGSEPQA